MWFSADCTRCLWHSGKSHSVCCQVVAAIFAFKVTRTDGMSVQYFQYPYHLGKSLWWDGYLGRRIRWTTILILKWCFDLFVYMTDFKSYISGFVHGTLLEVKKYCFVPKTVFHSKLFRNLLLISMRCKVRHIFMNDNWISIFKFIVRSWSGQVN